jgi:membrane-associated phospholipid phosphatase
MPRFRLTTGLFAMAALAACTDARHAPTAPRTVSPAASADKADAAANHVTASGLWNLRTRAIIGRRGGNSNAAARTYALVAVAQYDAVIAAEQAKDHAEHPSEAGAAAGASAGVLAALYPAEQSFIDGELAADGTSLPALPSERDADWDAGVAAGRAVAAQVVAYAASDRSKAVWTGTVPVGPGYWTSPPMPQDPMWGQIRPWLMTSGDEFRPAPPPPFGSTQYVTDLAEVHALSDNPTPDQLRIALFWAGTYGAGGPAGYFGALAVDLAAREHLDERKASRMLAVLHMAIMDASIGCYDGKYAYWYIRPYQADATIRTWVSKPSFPSYPSAHSCLSSAAGGVITGYFPSAADEMQGLVQEAGLARIYAGLHFRFDITAGQELGGAVAELALRLAPQGHRPIPLD